MLLLLLPIRLLIMISAATKINACRIDSTSSFVLFLFEQEGKFFRNKRRRSDEASDKEEHDEDCWWCDRRGVLSFCLAGWW